METKPVELAVGSEARLGRIPRHIHRPEDLALSHRRNLRGVAKDKTPKTPKAPKKKSKIKTLFKWIRRITFVAGIVGAVKKYQDEQKQQQSPPRP